MGIETAFQQMIILFVSIICGFAAYRLKIIDEAGCKVVTALVMNITLPCFIISSGFGGQREAEEVSMLVYFGASLLCYIAAYLIGTALSRLPFFKLSDRRLCSFMTTFGNNGFIGLPFVGALFGSDAVLYATIFNLPFNFLVFTIGIFLVSDKFSWHDIKPRMFVNACLIASVIAIILYLANVQAPPLITACLDTLGSATVPLAMIITGASLGKETPREVFANLGLYVVSLAKIALVPFVSYGILSLLIPNTPLVQIGTLLMAMPIAANSTILCLQYGGNDRMASRGVFLSTLLSVVSIPLRTLMIG